jgi:DNA-binding transcriptional ArsR family regulator
MEPSDAASRSLPNLWHIYNLVASPYFQTTLGSRSEKSPLSLFVGRRRELATMLATIGGSASSRQAVGGAPGIGKTTFVQVIKGEAVAANYWTTDEIVPLYPNDSLESVLGRIVAAVYDAIITARPQASAPALESAQQLVRAMRLSGGGMNLSMFGIGGGASKSQSAVNPPGAMLIDGPRILRDMLQWMRDAGAAGVILHIDNLENLSDRDTAEAADILRSLRDAVLLLDGLHLLLVGTTDAIQTVVNRHPQVRSVFSSPLELQPLSIEEVLELLEARYQHLALDSLIAPLQPVDSDTVSALYPLFRGDLRALLKAIEDGATALLGLSADAPLPVAIGDLRQVLQQRYAVQLQGALGEARTANLVAWAKVDPGSTQTQASLKALWELTQGSVSAALKALTEAGYVEQLPRQSGEATMYVLSGVSRLVFG